jgi:hypothetical protein
MRVEKISNLDFDAVYKILTSSKITDSQKTQFVLANRNEIKQIMTHEISAGDFKFLMDNRVLQKFRPLKNSYTKWGDKIILAKALDIPISEVPKYVKNVSDAIQDIDNAKYLPHSTMEMLKTYVYRHGTKDEIVTFLDYELTKTEDLLKCLYRTLEYYTGGVADYFIRPIHRMDNKTLIRVYGVINKNIKKSQEAGKISDAESKKIAKWALVQIYRIQNNSKFINAVKTYKTLK